MTRPSLTAVKVARNLVYLSGEPRFAALLPAGAAEATARLLEAAGYLQPWQQALLRVEGFRRFTRWVVRRTMPGVRLHLGLRKRFVDDEVRAAIANGASQLLMLGSGFDSLCLRLAAEHPRLLCVELDAPGTMERKRAAASECGSLRENLHLIAHDLRGGKLATALSQAEGWRLEGLSVVVAEAVLMYLPPAAVEALLVAIRMEVAGGSRLVFSYMEPDARGRVGRGIDRLTRASLRLIGEPLRWGVYASELPHVLASTGWRLDPDPGRVDLHERYLRPAGLELEPNLVVERVALAEAM